MVAPLIDLDERAKERGQYTYSTLLNAAKEELASGHTEDAKAIDLLAERIKKSYAIRGIQLEG